MRAAEDDRTEGGRHVRRAHRFAVLVPWMPPAIGHDDLAFNFPLKGSSSDSKEGATPPPNLPQVTSTFCKGDALVSLGGLSLLLGHRAGSMRGRADPRTPPRALRREFSATRREFRTEAAGGRWAERTEVETPQHTGRNAVNDSGDFLLTWNIRHASQGGADPLLDPPARAAPPAGQSEGDSLSLLR
eukprot:5729641-Pyramimonas_sp.AAC.1